MSERIDLTQQALHQGFVNEVLTKVLDELRQKTGQDPYVEIFNPTRMPPGSDRFEAVMELRINGVEVPVAEVFNQIWEGLDVLIEERAQAIAQRVDVALNNIVEAVEGMRAKIQKLGRL